MSAARERAGAVRVAAGAGGVSGVSGVMGAAGEAGEAGGAGRAGASVGDGPISEVRTIMGVTEPWEPRGEDKGGFGVGETTRATPGGTGWMGPNVSTSTPILGQRSGLALQAMVKSQIASTFLSSCVVVKMDTTEKIDRLLEGAFLKKAALRKRRIKDRR